MKILLKFIMLVFVLNFFTACQWNRDADIASSNLSKQADMFEINRRIIFYNGITGKYILAIKGYCSIKDEKNQLEVTCKIAPGQYKKHFLGLSDNVTYFAEQINSAKTSVSAYSVVFKPSAIIPNIDLE